MDPKEALEAKIAADEAKLQADEAALAPAPLTVQIPTAPVNGTVIELAQYANSLNILAKDYDTPEVHAAAAAACAAASSAMTQDGNSAAADFYAYCGYAHTHPNS